jgi:hypothetical protein
MSKYNRTYHLPYSPGATNDDRISDGVDSLLGKEIVITEKLDGSNTGMVDDLIYMDIYSYIVLLFNNVSFLYIKLFFFLNKK